jgi:PPOX class probable F420-dependent enzyme
MAIPIPGNVRELLDAPNYVHLTTLRADGSPRNWVVWVGLEDDHILVCTSDAIWKAKDMRRDPRVALSVTDTANPYRMAAIQGRVVDIRPDQDCRYMDPISIKYTGAPFPSRGPDRVCFRNRRRESRPAHLQLRPRSRLTHLAAVPARKALGASTEQIICTLRLPGSVSKCSARIRQGDCG